MIKNDLLPVIPGSSDIVSIENYSFGISGLDSLILSRVSPDKGVVLAPLDPYFIFSPICLPGISTRWAREFNLVPSALNWYYWLPFDVPYDVFEWFPRWDQSTKKYRPLNSSGYPIRLPKRSVTDWVSETTKIFKGYISNMQEAAA